MCGSSALWQTAMPRVVKQPSTALGDATFGDDAMQFGAGFGRGLLGRMTEGRKEGPLCFRRDPPRTGENCATTCIMVRSLLFWR